MTPVSLGDSAWLQVGTSSASTGAATNADSTPTVTVKEDGVVMGYAPTVSNVATGLYDVQIDATVGNGFEAGKRYSIYVTATVGGITGRDGIGEFEVLANDLNTVLDATISSRLATAGYTAPDNATIATIQADTNDIQARLPAALVGGRMDASVGAYQGGMTPGDATAANQATIIGHVDELESRLSAVRAGLLDNLVNLDLAVSTRGTANAGDAMALTAAAVDAILDEVIEGAYTMRQILRGYNSALMAKLSGADVNSPAFRDLADSKNRITATTDASGNRTAVTLDLT